MKLKTIKIQNFKSIKNLEFDFPSNNILILTGHNNAGKSNIVRAIDLICGDTWKKPDALDKNDFYLRDTENNIKIELVFDNKCTALFDTSMKKRDGRQDKWCMKYCNENGGQIYDPGIKDVFPCVYLGADRDFEKQTAFNNFSLLGKIKREFSKKAKKHEEELKANFKALNDIYEKVEGFTKFKSTFTEYFNSMQADAPVKLELDFKPFTPNNYFSNMNILAKDPDQTDEYDLDLAELGEGSKNIALISLLRSYAISFKESSGILILEEPELFLHPQARRHLFAQLKDLASHDFQVIISTHSTSFIETEIFESIGQVYKIEDEKNKGKTHTQLRLNGINSFVNFCQSTGAEKSTEKNIVPFYSILSDEKVTEGFFARIVILVEGETEEFVLPFLLKQAGLDCNLHNISVLRARGKTEIPKYWRLYNQYCAPVISIFDFDNNKENKETNLFNTFNIKSDQVVYTDGFYYLSNDIDVNKNNIKARTLVFEKDFETTLELDAKKQISDYDKIIEKANNYIQENSIKQKHQAALVRAKTINKENAKYTPKFIEKLVSVIKEIIDGKEYNPVYNPNIESNDINDDISF